MKGFTLVEALVTVLIFSIIFVAVFMILASGRDSWYTADVKIELHQEIRKALSTIDRELLQVRASVITAGPVHADSIPYSNITFKLPQGIDDLGNIIWSDNITYLRNTNNQIIRTTSSVSSVLANNISTLEFMRASESPDIIQVHIIAQKSTALGRILEDSITSSVKMRN